MATSTLHRTQRMAQIRRLADWELRRARRGRTVLWMVVATLAFPLLGVLFGRDIGDSSLDTLVDFAALHAVLLPLLVMAWTTASLRGAADGDLSDDWLLVFDGRDWLASRLLAGLRLGLILLAVYALSAAAVAASLGGGALFAAAGGCVLISASTLVAALALSAAVAASGWLLTSGPSEGVVAGGVLLIASWFHPLLSQLGQFSLVEAGAAGRLTVRLAITTGLWLLIGAVAWLAPLAAGRWARRRGRPEPLALAAGSDSLAAVRERVRAVRQKSRRRRQADRLARARERFARWGVEPTLAHDLARFDPLGRAGDGLSPVLLALGGAGVAGAIVRAVPHIDLEPLSVSLYVGSVCFGMVLWLRAFSSSVQAIAREREQGTLESLRLTPAGAKGVFDRKLKVLLWQLAGPLTLLGITLALVAGWGGLAGFAYAAASLLSITLAGLAASAGAANRATAGAMALGYLFLTSIIGQTVRVPLMMGVAAWEEWGTGGMAEVGFLLIFAVGGLLGLVVSWLVMRALAVQGVGREG